VDRAGASQDDRSPVFALAIDPLQAGAKSSISFTLNATNSHYIKRL
jgi:hypothetical protein